MNGLSSIRSRFNKKVCIFKSSNQFTLVVRSGKPQNSRYPKWLTLYGVKADHGHDFDLLADHMIKFRNFTNGEIREFSTVPFSLQ